jgi:opacity protein-like surface antigen
MPFCRFWIALGLMAVSGAQFAAAQEESSSSGAGATGSAAETAPVSPPAAPGAGSSSAFGTSPVAPSAATGAGSTLEAPAGAAGPPPSGTTPEADTGLMRPPAAEAPASFSVSPGYGQAAQIFISGEGRLARPKFTTRASVSMGFDDNIFQTPTNPSDIPEQRFQQQVSAGNPEQVFFVPVPATRRPQRIGAPIRPAPTPQQFRRVVIPATEPEFEEIVIPGSPAPKRKASAIARSSLSFEAQTATRRSVFTFDANVNADYYFSRPGKKTDYNGSLALIYLKRITPRLQFSGSVSAVYLQQPDLARINTPTDLGSGSYFNVLSKFDLSYRWKPRFSTVTSFSYNALKFEDETSQVNDYNEYALGTEFRYLWSPRLTVLIEGRYSQFLYENSPFRDSHTVFALTGFDLTLTRRAAATVRFGTAMRTFDESGVSSVTPYLESTLNYQLGRASYLQWSSRFGFEEPPDEKTEVLTLRTGLSVRHFFSPRLRGTLAANVLHQVATTEAGDNDTTRSTFDTSLGMEYSLTRDWSFNFTYSFTTVFGEPNDSDYFRNRLFLGANYEF